MKMRNSSLTREALAAVRRQQGKRDQDLEDQNYGSELEDVLIRSNERWDEHTLQLIDQVYKQEIARGFRGDVVSLEGIEPAIWFQGTKVAVWQGDITTLAGNHLAIVNAANKRALGCFKPKHRCIDNVIHRGAGPRLRMECADQMHHRGPLVAGSDPIVTNAYHLPCRYVIHVTGPQLSKQQRRNVSETARSLLTKAYENSLNAAVRVGATQIVFPGISTGVFGFPVDAASIIALKTVREWLKEHPGNLECIVFNTFSKTDTELYQHRFHLNFQVLPSALSSRYCQATTKGP